jgi:hypothetical protein
MVKAIAAARRNTASVTFSGLFVSTTCSTRDLLAASLVDIMIKAFAVSKFDYRIMFIVSPNSLVVLLERFTDHRIRDFLGTKSSLGFRRSF